MKSDENSRLVLVQKAIETWEGEGGAVLAIVPSKLAPQGSDRSSPLQRQSVDRPSVRLRGILTNRH